MKPSTSNCILEAIAMQRRQVRYYSNVLTAEKLYLLNAEITKQNNLLHKNLQHPNKYNHVCVEDPDGGQLVFSGNQLSLFVHGLPNEPERDKLLDWLDRAAIDEEEYQESLLKEQEEQI